MSEMWSHVLATLRIFGNWYLWNIELPTLWAFTKMFSRTDPMSEATFSAVLFMSIPTIVLVVGPVTFLGLPRETGVIVLMAIASLPAILRYKLARSDRFLDFVIKQSESGSKSFWIKGLASFVGMLMISVGFMFWFAFLNGTPLKRPVIPGKIERKVDHLFGNWIIEEHTRVWLSDGENDEFINTSQAASFIGDTLHFDRYLVEAFGDTCSFPKYSRNKVEIDSSKVDIVEVWCNGSKVCSIVDKIERPSVVYRGVKFYLRRPSFVE